VFQKKVLLTGKAGKKACLLRGEILGFFLNGRGTEN